MGRRSYIEMGTGRAWFTLLASVGLLCAGTLASLGTTPVPLPWLLAWAVPGSLGVMYGLLGRRVLVADHTGLTVAWRPVGVPVVDVTREEIAFVSVDVEYRWTVRYRATAILIGSGWELDVVPKPVVSAHLRDGRSVVLVRRVSAERAKRVAGELRRVLQLAGAG